MLFNSYLFLLVFLPVCLAGYFGLNRLGLYKTARLFLIGMSAWFYGFVNPSYLLLLAFSIGANYLFSETLRRQKNTGLKKCLLTAAVALNLGLLFYYKYCDFFLYNLNRIFATDFAMREVILPLGISFFTFQQIAYLVDTYRGEVPAYSLLDHTSFVAFFPQMLSGPIVTHEELLPQFLDVERKTFQWDNFARGLYLFTLGMSKKVLIADTFGRAADWGFANIPGMGTTNALFTMLAYMIQIYFDFSGYSDMTIALAKMLNFDLPVNFDSPLKALTITDFWKRWHKTLTRFLTKYIYFPLGGSRKGTMRTCVNIMIVFLISGIWHGANYTFIFWGLLHGLLQIVTRMFRKQVDAMHPALSWMMTFSLVTLSFVLFRAESVSKALTFLGQLLVMELTPVDTNIVGAFLRPEISALLTWVPFLRYFATYPTALLWLFYGGALLLILGCRNAYSRMRTFRPTLWNGLTMAGLLTLCVLSFSSVSSFLYFDF